MRLFIKIIFGCLGLLILGSGIFYASNKQHVDAFPSIVPAFFAKEYCSCRFVVGQDDAFCREVAHQVLEIQSLTVDETTKTVEVVGPRILLGRQSRAQWIDERRGCRLVDSFME